MVDDALCCVNSVQSLCAAAEVIARFAADPVPHPRPGHDPVDL